MTIAYELAELHYLLRQWRSGNLDQLMDAGSPKPGLRGVVVTSRGLRSQTLVERFTAAEVERALVRLFRRDPEQAAAVVLCHALDYPVEALAAGLGSNCLEAGSFLLCAEDAFVQELYEQETEATQSNSNPGA